MSTQHTKAHNRIQPQDQWKFNPSADVVILGISVNGSKHLLLEICVSPTCSTFDLTNIHIALDWNSRIIELRNNCESCESVPMKTFLYLERRQSFRRFQLYLF